jgi:hypothetical protein
MLRTDDSAALARLIPAAQRGSLAGQVAIADVPAGSFIPAGVSAPAATAGLWEVPLPIKRMPLGLRAGDHVAVLVTVSSASGQPAEVVVGQDVRVLAVASDLISLWLPAAAAAQMEWYADHGGIVLVRMQPGSAQKNLPAGAQP